MKLTSILTAAILLATPAAALAHAPKIGVNGGPQTNAGPYHMELIAKEKALDVYLRDHGDKAVATAGFAGTAIFVIDGKSERIELKPTGDNRLTGTASIALPNEPAGVVRVTMPGGGTAQGQFK